jgi:hypothetical protein
MSTLFDILVRGSAQSDLDATITELEVEENVDLPGAFTFTLPVTTNASGDLDPLSDSRLAPLSNVAITAQAGDGQTHCLIDGFVLAHNIHLDTGTTQSHIKVWGQDASWLMNREEKAREWVDVTDGTVANTIFGEYGFTPGDGNLDDDSAAHTEDGHSLMQRATDAQFLRTLARRNGKLFRVFCTSTPGQRTGFFGKPKIDGDPASVLTLNPSSAATIDAIDVSWDVMRPTAVTAKQALFSDNDPEGAGGTTTDSGLAQMDQKGLADFSGQTVTALLTAPVDDAGQLTLRAQAVLREAGWFARCQGTADAGRLGSILRAGTVARLDAAGAVHSGKYFVWSVRHKITPLKHTMDFVLVRNAVGAPATGGSLLGGIGL